MQLVCLGITPDNSLSFPELTEFHRDVHLTTATEINREGALAELGPDLGWCLHRRRLFLLHCLCLLGRVVLKWGLLCVSPSEVGQTSEPVALLCTPAASSPAQEEAHGGRKGGHILTLLHSEPCDCVPHAICERRVWAQWFSGCALKPEHFF